jgi:hypothetical protein
MWPPVVHLLPRQFSIRAMSIAMIVTDTHSNGASSIPRPLATRWILSFAAAALVAGSLWVGTAEQRAAADEIAALTVTPAAPQRPLSRRDRMVAGLKARLKSEVAFIDKVLEAVRLGRLPQKLVDQTYFWARLRASRPRSGRPRRPIIYFQPAMRARAKVFGIIL